MQLLTVSKQGKSPEGSSPVISDGTLLQDLCEQKNNCKTVNLCVCVCVYSCCEIIQVFVKGIWRGLCHVQNWLVYGHSSSQAMFFASFVQGIIIRCTVLPYYCHMIENHCKESQK